MLNYTDRLWPFLVSVGDIFCNNTATAFFHASQEILADIYLCLGYALCRLLYAIYSPLNCELSHS